MRASKRQQSPASRIGPRKKILDASSRDFLVARGRDGVAEDANLKETGLTADMTSGAVTNRRLVYTLENAWNA